MKLSLAAASAILLSAFATLTQADEYADAMKQWCEGLAVTAPADNDVVVAGSPTSVTVTRTPNDHEKKITGLDLYSVSSDSKAKYVSNIWHGEYNLDSSATLPDTIPAGSAPGLYLYRVWVTNQINGMHGPDCLETSHTFKVTSAVHTNADGISSYAESLDDPNHYHPEHFKGCFGLDVAYPKKDSSFKAGEHIRITANRDTASQTESLLQVDLYKSSGNDNTDGEFVDTVWEGSERFVNAFTLKDHLNLPEDKIDASSSYYYVLKVSSNKASESDDPCQFQSKAFKIEAAN